MKIITKPINKRVILKEHNSYFKTMIKAVVDIEKGLLALDAELHADLEAQLLENGSKQENLWGINLYLEKSKKNWIEYTALINIRPSMGHKSMEVTGQNMREQISAIVDQLILE